MSASTKRAPQALADMALWFDVQSFLFMEARLLDDQFLHQWTELFTEDVRYWMPIITNRTGRDIGKERTAYGELAHFDENKTSLTNRVRRLDTGMAWAETPPSRTRHLVTNVEVMERVGDAEVLVRSNFLIYRSHLEYDTELFAGMRDDTLRRRRSGTGEGSGTQVENGWQIAKRTIILDQSVVTQKNLGIFF
jgi:3-phenylpropionate/cinnamic acid dioxygenase small subunit